MKFAKKTFSFLFIFIIIIGLILFFRPSNIVSKEIAKKDGSVADSKFLNWKGNEVHYTDRGSGDIILLIHGFGGSYYNFEVLSGKLSNNYRVINVDLPGSGLSDFNQSSQPNVIFFDQFKDYFSFLVDTLNLDSFHLVGNSLGGVMAYSIAVSMPEKVKDLILINSAGYELDKVIAKGAGPMRFKWVKPLVEKGAPMFLVKYFVTFPFADKSKVDTSEFRYDYLLTNRAGNLNCQVDLASSHQYPDTTIIKNIKCPTLILWGKEDNIIPVEHASKFKRDIINSQVKIYSPCGHMPQMEISDSVLIDLKRFYSENKIKKR